MQRIRGALIPGLGHGPFGSACGAGRRSRRRRQSTRFAALYEFDKYGKQPISFYYCQAGFPADGYKPVYVWTRQEFSAGTAAVHCATGNTVSVPLRSHGDNVLGGGRTGLPTAPLSGPRATTRCGGTSPGTGRRLRRGRNGDAASIDGLLSSTSFAAKAAPAANERECKLGASPFRFPRCRR